jgi:hypothetical protein
MTVVVHCAVATQEAWRERFVFDDAIEPQQLRRKAGFLKFQMRWTEIWMKRVIRKYVFQRPECDIRVSLLIFGIVPNEQFDAVAAANSQAPLQFASFNLRLIHELKPV